VSRTGPLAVHYLMKVVGIAGFRCVHRVVSMAAGRRAGGPAGTYRCLYSDILYDRCLRRGGRSGSMKYKARVRSGMGYAAGSCPAFLGVVWGGFQVRTPAV
jgi:hypothetical protein